MFSVVNATLFRPLPVAGSGARSRLLNKVFAFNVNLFWVRSPARELELIPWSRRPDGNRVWPSLGGFGPAGYLHDARKEFAPVRGWARASGQDRAAFLSARNDAYANIAIILAGLMTAAAAVYRRFAKLRTRNFSFSTVR